MRRRQTALPATTGEASRMTCGRYEPQWCSRPAGCHVPEGDAGRTPIADHEWLLSRMSDAFACHSTVRRNGSVLNMATGRHTLGLAPSRSEDATRSSDPERGLASDHHRYQGPPVRPESGLRPVLVSGFSERTQQDGI